MADPGKTRYDPSIWWEYLATSPKYDRFGNQDTFKAKILAKANDNGDTIFYVRIEDDDMPHKQYLEDPVSLSKADQNEPIKSALLIYGLHSQIKIPSGKTIDASLDIDDEILVRCLKGDNGDKFSLQNLEYVDLLKKNDNNKTTSTPPPAASSLSFNSAPVFQPTPASPPQPALQAAPPPAAAPAPPPPVIPSTTGLAGTLQQRYFQLEFTPGPNLQQKKDLARYIYSKMKFAGLGDSIIYGIMANAYVESGFNPWIVSQKPNEVSLGLWQCNVGRLGIYGRKTQEFVNREAILNIPRPIIIGYEYDEIPYFAGGLITKEYGYDNSRSISAETYRSNPAAYQDRTYNIYDVVTNRDNQINFVIARAKSMLQHLGISIDDNSIDAGDWANWWLIYFEQPGTPHSRIGAVQSVKRLLVDV